MSRSVVDYENVLSQSFSDSNRARVCSGARSRWERKQQQQQQPDEQHQSAANHSSSQPSRRALSAFNGTSSHTSSGGADRFIPNRSAMDMELSKHLLHSEKPSETSGLPEGHKVVSDACKDEYHARLSATLLGVEDANSHRILSFTDRAPPPKGDTVNNLNVLYSGAVSRKGKSGVSSRLIGRQIPTAPSRILDAPDLNDDYYLSLLSWSDNNVLAVALGQTVYLWNASSGDIQDLCTYEEGTSPHITSVSWVQEGGTHLAVGTSGGTTQLWDVEACKQLRSMDGHSDRVGSLAWNRYILTSGSRDTTVIHHDVRVARHRTATLAAHTQEVCGLAWSRDGEILASGGNDNLLCLWDAAAASATSSLPRHRLTDHHSAVKALAWSPHERQLLASGGGTADRTIKFWNSSTGALLNSIDTGSQVCGLLWNPYEKEILSGHGYARNELCLWKYPSMVKIKELEGHTSRVLHLALSPDGGTVVSAAGDETLRFWDVFAAPAGSKTSMIRGTQPSYRMPAKLSKTLEIR
jgi:cell division cycle protein 20 (cofactor of APC complex)